MKKTSIIINTEEIQHYIKDIRKIKVMSHERQDFIFARLKSEDITLHEKNQILSELVTGNLRFVITIAKSYQNNGLDLIDLISEGNIGLIKAAERFDPDSGNKFISYAVWWIRQSIMSSLNEHSRTIRLPSNIIQETQKKRKINEVAVDYFGNVDDDINNKVEIELPYCVNLFDEINEEGETLFDTIVNVDADNPEDIFKSKEEIKQRVSKMLSVLDNREKTIIEKTYGLNGIESNLDDLGEEFGCTKERIRQLRDRALKKLRNDSYHLLKTLN
jgi:RNA polymerase primary sigma factor